MTASVVVKDSAKRTYVELNQDLSPDTASILPEGNLSLRGPGTLKFTPEELKKAVSDLIVQGVDHQHGKPMYLEVPQDLQAARVEEVPNLDAVSFSTQASVIAYAWNLRTGLGFASR